MSVKKFKKPNGYIIVTDSKVHKQEYIQSCSDMFEEVSDKPKKAKAKSKKKESK